MQQQTISWQALDYPGIENGRIEFSGAGIFVQSTVVGYEQTILFKVEYVVKVNAAGQTTFFECTYQLNNFVKTIAYESDGNGNWLQDGKPVQELTGCVDIDISVTPFTNTLPIKRLSFNAGERQKISVLYVDVLAQQVMRADQFYTRLSDKKYLFETAGGDFSAELEVDEQGLVLRYPALFKRID